MSSKRKYNYIKTSKTTSTLTKVRATLDNMEVDRMGTATIEYKGKGTGSEVLLNVRIEKYVELRGITTTLFKLFDVMLIKLTENQNSKTITISLDEYMKLRGIKKREYANEQTDEDLMTLTSLQLYDEKAHQYINVADSGKILPNGDIEFKFGDTFHQRMTETKKIMPYPLELLKIDNNRYPNSYYFGRKLAEHKNMNLGKTDENIIAVKSLLNVSEYIATYEKIKEHSKRNYSRYIIKPFERDMNALSNILHWDYVHKNGIQLTAEERAEIDYRTFIELNIVIAWIDYPSRKPSQKQLEKAAEKPENGAK